MAFLVGAAVGTLIVLLFIANGFVDLDAWFEDRWPFPMWATAVPAVGFVGVMALWSWRTREPLMWVITAAMVPLATGTVAVRVTEPFLWVPLFGLSAWLVSSIVLTRRMT